MANVAALYNTLPSIDEADKKFVNRDQIFSKLTPLLTTYDKKYGVCLVHRHCTLEEGEMMVASGNVSQPERDVQCYPDRWLATGEPYEFTRQQTLLPPQGLLEEFQKIVDGLDVLGLFYIQDEDRLGEVNLVERTEGRKNIMEIVPHIQSSNTISTAWLADVTLNKCHCCVHCKPPTHSKCE